jgi:hypothetical protein
MVRKITSALAKLCHILLIDKNYSRNVEWLFCYSCNKVVYLGIEHLSVYNGLEPFGG